MKLHSTFFFLPCVAMVLMACGGADVAFEDEGQDGSADGASDGMGGDSSTDGTPGDSDPGDGSTDGTGGDTTVSDSTPPTDSTPPPDTTVVPDTPTCPPLALGGATEDVYVDKSAAPGGNGTKTCPFLAISSATGLAAPGSTVTRRFIHVKGNATSPDYDDLGTILLASKVTLTSNYDSPTDGNVNNVRIIARWDCSSVAGGGATCAVGMANDSRIELMTVRARSVSGSSVGHGILTTNVLPASGQPAPKIIDVIAENAIESGIRVNGSADIGPRVIVRNNRNQGVNCSRSGTAPQGNVHIYDAPSLTGAPSNNFDSNNGNGLAVFGNFVVVIDGLSATKNTAHGVVVGTPLTSTASTSHTFSNVQLTGNSQNGLRLISGEIKVKTGTFTNRFNGNGAYGIETTSGDGIGDARIILDPKLDLTGGYLLGHEAMSNAQGGVHLAETTPPSSAPHNISSLNGSSNGSSSSSTRAAGIYVQVTGANQPSLILRGSTLQKNSGAGLRFQKASGNSLDIGTTTTGGFNIWGDSTGTNLNLKTAICYENLTTGVVTQSAERDRWSSSCPLPLTSGTFQTSVSGCYANGSYVEITYTGSSAPISAVVSCF